MGLLHHPSSQTKRARSGLSTFLFQSIPWFMSKTLRACCLHREDDIPHVLATQWGLCRISEDHSLKYAEALAHFVDLMVVDPLQNIWQWGMTPGRLTTSFHFPIWRSWQCRATTVPHVHFVCKTWSTIWMPFNQNGNVGKLYLACI